MSASPADGVACHGLPPLTARLSDWQRRLSRDHASLMRWMDEHGSPINVLEPSGMGVNAAELQAAAAAAGVDLAVYFARKANKALCFVDEARRLGLGVDLASERELQQALEHGMPGTRLVMTAAVKPPRLLDRCIEADVTVVLDNADEVARFVARGGRTAALRVAPSIPGRRPTRFGMTPQDARAVVRATPGLQISGLHFHLDGYAAAERVAGLDQTLPLVDALVADGHPVGFVDIGGGIPMSYLDSREQWEGFWAAQRAALAGAGPSVTFEDHPLDTVYPYHQTPTRGAWLTTVLDAPLLDGTPVAEGLRGRGLQLRLEPGRSLMDGCGMTVARVAHRKQRADGEWLISLEMNRTQCRSTSDDFLVDPLLVRAPGPADAPLEGYLVGAYCIERELLSLRRLRFGQGVGLDDLVVFPNTGGYLMHILESSSHQIPLARNLVLGPDGTSVTLDAIDRPA